MSCDKIRRIDKIRCDAMPCDAIRYMDKIRCNMIRFVDKIR